MNNYWVYTPRGRKIIQADRVCIEDGAIYFGIFPNDSSKTMEIIASFPAKETTFFEPSFVK